MLLKAFLTTFALVFLAELGDKTQLATMLLVSQGQPMKMVFLGAASALVLSSLIGVLAGAWLGKIFPPNVIQNGAGVAFIGIGILLLLGKF
ncbi:TMEM165/GDT1 family protein [Dethiobacter alkaliphilus]|uniref:TMEM165/GDT1 family protein n=1 Tax=Dethiobacter alkaliphilus TaxID=427926 RepID=UPI002226916B|nr:TMEM165/GDT1 family protein [Dethiobacter alkaliphilus]MCW3490789.1 TMEM165/GDT1 family protein [Dethiobacter alkaliphilus]